jgi:type II secretory pathway predicted ATPase ExeA
MFLEHFGLIEQPFGVTPDPRFLHLGPQHREALASLVYGTESNRGFMALIGPPGMGKTTLLYQFLEGQRERARSAFVFQTDCQPRELLRHILSDLGVEAAGKDFPTLRETLNRVLLEEMNAGRRFILVIDEAQNLEEKILESVRLLSNFETPWKKLMQIVIAGQPQLEEQLARPSMAQLRQRISSVIRLRPFTPEETHTYISHRLWVAGYSGPDLLTVGARLKIAEASQGIPRNINNLCFNAMSIAYAAGVKRIDTKIVEEVLEDLRIGTLAPITAEAEPIESRGLPQRRSLGDSCSRSFGALSLLGPPQKALSPRPTRRRVFAIASSIAALGLLGLGGGISWQHGARLPSFDVLRAEGNRIQQAVAQKVERRVELSRKQRIAQPAEVSPPDASALPDIASPPVPPILTIAASATPPQPYPASEINQMQAGDSAASDGTLTVTATRDVTLRQLSLRYIGRFDMRTLDEIFVLNPGISDPDRIAAGQRIRLPLFLRGDGWQPAEEAAIRGGTANEEKP